MTKTPIDIMLEDVVFTPLPGADRADIGDGVPVATHEGWLKFGGDRLRCYQLSDGRRIFDLEELEDFFGAVRIPLSEDER